MIKNLTNEIWKDIEGFEGKYQVSNYGRIKSLKRFRGKRIYEECIKTQKINKDGYCVVKLYDSVSKKILYYLVHRLVGLNFIPNDDPINKFQINHKDECKTNNVISNLEWCDNDYNFNYNNRSCLKRAIENREKKRVNGILKNKHSRQIEQIDVNTNEVVNTFETITDVGNKTGYSKGTICNACRKGLIAYGFRWTYKV